MKLIERTEITDSNLISTNVAEDDQPVWLSGTAYAVGDLRMVLATHSIYEAITTSTDKYPPENLTGETPAWLFIGTTNAWKMFNQSYAAQTTNADSIVASFSLGRTNSIGLLNVEAANINIKMEIGGTEVYNYDVDMRLRSVTNLYEYFYTPIELRSEVVVTDMPMSGGVVVTVSITGSPGQDVKCGLCIPGSAIDLGKSLWGLSGGTDNFSRKQRDIYGGFDTLDRGYSKTRSDSVFMPNERTGHIERILQPYYTKPGLWVSSEKYEFSYIYGPYRDFSIVLSDPSGAYCSITIESLV